MQAKRTWIAVAVGLVAVAVPSSAGAAVTLGSDLTKSVTDLGVMCTQPCTQVPRTIPGRQTTAPLDGVVVRWRIKKTDFDWGTVQLRIMRQVSTAPVTYVGAGTSAPQAVGSMPTGILEFPTALPIQAGDYIGLEADTFQTAANQPGVAYDDVRPPPPDGGPPSAVLVTRDDEVLLNADVEPDCDNDGSGDETQDPNVFGGDCPPRGRTLTLDANKNKGKKVTLSGQLTEVLRQGECQTTQTVELQRKKPSQSGFTTVEQLQTDAAGNFTAKKKVKKTFEYRAQVLETATCAGQTSNTEKVKVKKKD
jgi:hypothetical protein